MMKIKLMPLLANVVAVSVLAVPFAAKASTINHGQPLLAQGGQGQTQGNTRKHRGAWAKLNLSETQKQQMRDLHKETREKIQAVFTDEQKAKLKAAREQGRQGQNRQSRKDMMASLNLTEEQKATLKSIRQEQKAKMDSILSKEQKAQLEQMRSSRKQGWQQRNSR
jgi:periplasmic protein CpxP/Spy